MSAAFKSMSDLVADSEDLLGRIGRSKIPQVRELLQPFRQSVDQLKQQLRDRAKQLRRPESQILPQAQSRPAQVVAAAFVASFAVAWLYHVLKSKS